MAKPRFAIWIGFSLRLICRAGFCRQISASSSVPWTSSANPECWKRYPTSGLPAQSKKNLRPMAERDGANELAQPKTALPRRTFFVSFTLPELFRVIRYWHEPRRVDLVLYIGCQLPSLFPRDHVM